MEDISISQYKIIKAVNEEVQLSFNKEELTEDHWILVRKGYLKNFVTFGPYDWILRITEKGIEYLANNTL